MYGFRLRDQNPLVLTLWGTLALAMVVALAFGNWSLAFVALTTLLLAIAPALLARRLNITLPVPFLFATTVFIIASVFMGEAFDFYERFWWWDIALHGASALGFGLIGFLFIFMLFEGDRYAAPPAAMAVIAFACGVTVGATWEIFEFLMDVTFDLNMQKSGLVDTMGDLIVDTIGAAIGGLSGYFYLRGSSAGILPRALRQFVDLNRRLYEKSRQKLQRDKPPSD
jgi:hypothetical protein